MGAISRLWPISIIRCANFVWVISDIVVQICWKRVFDSGENIAMVGIVEVNIFNSDLLVYNLHFGFALRLFLFQNVGVEVELTWSKLMYRCWLVECNRAPTLVLLSLLAGCGRVHVVPVRWFISVISSWFLRCDIHRSPCWHHTLLILVQKWWTWPNQTLPLCYDLFFFITG